MYSFRRASRSTDHDPRTRPPDAVGAREPYARLATWGVAGVLVVTAGYAMWSTSYTASVAREATAANRLSSNYAAAAKAVALEESLERKYRLEPGLEVRTRYDNAAADLVAAMNTVVRDGSSSDRATVDRVLSLHDPYLDAIARMYAAVDAGDAALVLTIDGEEVDPLFGEIEQIVDSAADAHFERSMQSLDRLGDVEQFAATATPIVFVIGLLFLAGFASVLRRVRRQLDVHRGRALHDSLHDALTGLPNRVLLADCFEDTLRSGRPTGLLLIDLDRFKEVNDTLGHHYGDALLTQIGPRLAAGLLDGDLVARLGGDEFAILLPHISTVAGALSVAERVRQSLAAPFVVYGVELSIDASVGVVVSGVHGTDSRTLLQRADVAMYVAKEQGLGACAYDPEIDGHSRDRLGLLGDLRQALNSNQFTLHYQPKLSLRTGQLCGTEALIRWEHPTRGMVFPDAFIPLAEHTALIGPLTLRVLDLAIGQIRTWLDLGHRIPVAVNLSARNMLDERLVEQVLDRLAAHDVEPALLELEITESAIMVDPARARTLLTRLEAHGISISIDDFGAGYTSLAELKALPVTELKVDRSFVMTMDTDPANAVIVRSIIDLGHNLGLVVSAEGVETAASRTTLESFGCDTAQGYHLCRPVPAAALLAWFVEHDAADDRIASDEALDGHDRHEPLAMSASSATVVVSVADAV